jgi:hypothetical protein
MFKYPLNSTRINIIIIVLLYFIPNHQILTEYKHHSFITKTSKEERMIERKVLNIKGSEQLFGVI